jgi:membrane associated rhomboid family serine protease
LNDVQTLDRVESLNVVQDRNPMLPLLLESVAVVALMKVLLDVGGAVSFAELRRRAVPWGIVVLWAAVAVPSIVQNWWPRLGTALRQDPTLVETQHQYWRLATALCVQDSLAGTVFNLVMLALVGLWSARCWGTLRTVILFVTFGTALNGVAALSGATTAGNSGATFALAASVAGCRVFSATGTARLSAATAVGFGAVMLVLGDYHGEAILLGGMAGGLLSLLGVRIRRRAASVEVP